MPVEINGELIDYLQKLGRIRLSEEDKQKTIKDLGSIMGYIDKLNELDTTGVEPMSHAFGTVNVVREDKVTNDDMRDKVISNAPKSVDGTILVPKTFD
ncbi:MAG: Asp-tRNA(Asn)/Glu-tRNA(Gln) amidotransferase subunit GatC [Clostridiales bacterium]|nr:Asp-tRNA(Asn)/Glu-tRNA(Gln) amidotransferase subunit GatC [Clostridiales bacterium]